MRTYLALYLGTMLVTLVATRVLIALANKWHILDLPGVRKVHPRPVPRIGGLAIFVGMLGPLLAVLLLDNVIGRAFRENQTGVLALLGCGAFICLVGLIDDVHPLSAQAKLVFQLSAAIAMVVCGVRIQDLFSIHLGWLSWPVTLLWLVGITNAVNLIDGLDGLAAGVGAIACGVIAVFSYATDQSVMTALMLAILGSLSGFLVLNFNPARIFMGDSGSMFLGFMIAGSGALCSNKKATALGLVMPGLALGVPLFDMAVAVVRRVLQRRGIMSPDRSHVHHRLVAMGLTQRRAVLLLYSMTLVAAGLALFLMILQNAERLVVFGSVIVLLIVTFHMLGSFRLDHAFLMFKRNRVHARVNRELRMSFESAELRLREAKNVKDWWAAISDAADHLGFSRLELTLASPDGDPHDFAWVRPNAGDAPTKSDQIVRVSLPVRHGGNGDPVHVRLEVPLADSLESAGQGVTLFGRLLDSYGHVPHV